MLPRNWSRALLAAPAVAVLVTATGCASAKDAEPETKTGADDEASWELAKGTLDLRAKCSKLANCDVRFKVEVPKSVKVLRNGRPTDLKGVKRQAAGSPSQAAAAIRTRA
ncbi:MULTISPECIES: hypothetical protein [unclassified Streptomyces]|uniref:hypothetical protein n=1 Tax=unclassified Streptomyces TaxID=2593676 RepID=UPI002E18B415|nr:MULTISPECIES: hypothetical protein [unclassified Streptomyces]